MMQKLDRITFNPRSHGWQALYPWDAGHCQDMIVGLVASGCSNAEILDAYYSLFGRGRYSSSPFLMLRGEFKKLKCHWSIYENTD